MRRAISCLAVSLVLLAIVAGGCKNPLLSGGILHFDQGRYELRVSANGFGPVRGSLVKLLAKRGTASDKALAIDVLAHDDEPRARRMAAEALGGFQDAEAADALLAALGSELPTWQLHGALLVSLVLLKLVVVNVFKQFLKLAPVMGMMLVVLTLLVATLSLVFFLIVRPACRVREEWGEFLGPSPQCGGRDL